MPPPECTHEQPAQTSLSYTHSTTNAVPWHQQDAEHIPFPAEEAEMRSFSPDAFPSIHADSFHKETHVLSSAEAGTPPLLVYSNHNVNTIN